MQPFHRGVKRIYESTDASDHDAHSTHRGFVLLRKLSVWLSVVRWSLQSAMYFIHLRIMQLHQASWSNDRFFILQVFSPKSETLICCFSLSYVIVKMNIYGLRTVGWPNKSISRCHLLLWWHYFQYNQQGIW